MAIWSQGSVGVFKWYSCNLISFFVNFQVLFKQCSGSGVIMWSQGSSGVLKSCSYNLFEFFPNFQVLFMCCSFFVLCDLRVQVVCKGHVLLILIFLFSFLYSCNVQQIRFFNLVPVDIGQVVMWCQGSSDAQKTHAEIWCLVIQITWYLHPVPSHSLPWISVFH